MRTASTPARPAASVRHERRDVPCLPGRPARVVVVADTHSRPHPASRALIMDRAPDLILHAGDIGELAVVDALAEIAPVVAVRGNIDDRASGIADVVTLTFTREGAVALRLLLLHIAVAGVRIRADVARLAHAERASLVVCGHSHIPFMVDERGLTLFNPGSVGPRRFGLPIVFGTLEIPMPGAGLRLAHVDCETGAEWAPP